MVIVREQVPLRLPVDLARWVKQTAADQGLSVNAWATVVFQTMKHESEQAAVGT